MLRANSGNWLWKLILTICLCFPVIASAQYIITITPVTTFNSEVLVSSTASATYRVTNTASRIPITVVDQSQLPRGIAITATTCGSVLAPGQSCLITLGLQAPDTATVLQGKLREWAKPSLEGVEVPISVTVKQNFQYTITPGVIGSGGTISPSSPVVTNNDTSQTFTATPASGYAVNQWFVDGVVVQTGGTSYTLSNINANHTVQVSFKIQYTINASVSGGNGAITPTGIISVDSGANVVFTATAATNFAVNQWLLDGSVVQVGGSTYTLTNITANHTVQVSYQSTIFVITGINNNTGFGIIVSSVDTGNSFALRSFSHPGGNFSIMGSGCTPQAVNAVCVASASTPFRAAFLLISQDGGLTWTNNNGAGFPTLATPFGVACTGVGSTSSCYVVGEDDTSGSQPLILASHDGANTFAQQTIVGLAPGTHGIIYSVACTNEDNSYCIAAGLNGDTNQPLLVTSTNGGITWVVTVTPVSTVSGVLEDTTCTGTGSTATCIAGGTNSTDNAPMAIVTTNRGTTWQTVPMTVSGGALDLILTVNCSHSGADGVCFAVGIGNGLPYAVVSQDGGNTWQDAIIPGTYNSLDTILSVSCTGAEANTLCVLAGGNIGSLTTNPYILLVTTDKGNSFSRPTISGATSNGAFAGSKCFGGGNTAVCTIGGQDGNSMPLLATTHDGGTTWTAVAASGVTDQGIYNEFVSGATTAPQSFRHQFKTKESTVRELLEF